MEYPQDFENFWIKYGEPKTTKGPKRKALESWEEVKKQWCKEENSTPQEFCREVERGRLSEEANRKAARQSGDFVAQMPMAVTWINQWRFEQEHQTSTGALKAKSNPRTCTCGSDQVIGRQTSTTWICEPCFIEEWKQKNTLKPLLNRFPKGDKENWTGWSIRVMSHFPAGRKLKEKYGL